MKKYKLHIISIVIIFMMILFALGTSFAVYEELTIKNNSTKILKFEITRQEKFDLYEYTEIFTLRFGEDLTIKTFKGMNTMAPPDYYINNIIIYNENNEILKVFKKDADEPNITEIKINLVKEKRRIKYYTWEITDEMLYLNKSIL